MTDEKNNSLVKCACGCNRAFLRNTAWHKFATSSCRVRNSQRKRKANEVNDTPKPVVRQYTDQEYEIIAKEFRRRKARRKELLEEMDFADNGTSESKPEFLFYEKKLAGVMTLTRKVKSSDLIRINQYKNEGYSLRIELENLT